MPERRKLHQSNNSTMICWSLLLPQCVWIILLHRPERYGNHRLQSGNVVFWINRIGHNHPLLAIQPHHQSHGRNHGHGHRQPAFGAPAGSGRSGLLRKRSQGANQDGCEKDAHCYLATMHIEMLAATRWDCIPWGRVDSASATIAYRQALPASIKQLVVAGVISFRARYFCTQPERHTPK